MKRLSEGDPEDPGVYAALSLYGEQLRRQQRYSEALPLWRRMMDCAGPQDLHPWRAAAVALEHRLGRLEEALQLVEELFALLEDGPGTRLHDPEELRELKKRRDRLLRRAGSDPGSRARPSSPGRGDCGA